MAEVIMMLGENRLRQEDRKTGENLQKLLLRTQGG